MAPFLFFCMSPPRFHITFESDWRIFPMAYWVHTRAQGDARPFAHEQPAEFPNRGFAVLRVFLEEHRFMFSSPLQLAHFIEILARKPLPSSLRLSALSSAHAGPNQHWLSRLPSRLKSPRKREKVVEAMKFVYDRAVQPDGAGFKLTIAQR